jgi:hypothetical protein
MAQIGSGTAEGLIGFLEQLVSKGRATTGAIMPLQSAATRVFTVVEGDSWKSVDVRTINVYPSEIKFRILPV